MTSWNLQSEIQSVARAIAINIRAASSVTCLRAAAKTFCIRRAMNDRVCIGAERSLLSLRNHLDNIYNVGPYTAIDRTVALCSAE